MELPALFIASIREAGIDAGALASALASDPVTAIRLNAFKPAELPYGATPVSWCERGYYLDGRPKFTLDPALHQGRYYVQDASSMFIATVANRLAEMLPEGSLYLDACAAPGGKATAAIDALPSSWGVVANEIVPKRAAALRENIIKWGAPNVIVTRGDTRAFAKAGEMFAIVAADVPCSGEGMMRKDPQALAQWSPGLVEECAERQREILANLWRTLLPGGYLIYSTCTFNLTENDRMVQWIMSELGAGSVSLKLDSAALGTHDAGLPTDAWRFMPHITRGEGLFMAVVRKPGEITSPPASKKIRQNATPKIDPAIRKWIKGGDEMEFTVENDRINAFPRQLSLPLRSLSRVTDIIHHGTVLCHIKGRDYIPAHQLAMSRILAPEAFPAVEVDHATAISYLRREPVAPEAGWPRGTVLLEHNGCPLGFVKNLGNRTNSLYPAEWRILH